MYTSVVINYNQTPESPKMFSPSQYLRCCLLFHVNACYHYELRINAVNTVDYQEHPPQRNDKNSWPISSRSPSLSAVCLLTWESWYTWCDCFASKWPSLGPAVHLISSAERKQALLNLRVEEKWERLPTFFTKLLTAFSAQVFSQLVLSLPFFA